MRISEFCKTHRACSADRAWALSLGIETVEELWARDDMSSAWRLWIATRPGVLSARKLRMFAVFCAHRNWEALTDGRSRTAVDVAARYAQNEASASALSDAFAAATFACDEACSCPASIPSNAAAAARAAAHPDAVYAAISAAAAHSAGARAAAHSAGTNAVDASAAADAEQSAWLLKNATPTFCCRRG